MSRTLEPEACAAFETALRAALPRLTEEEVNALFDVLTDEPLEYTAEPSTGLMMLTAEDSFRESFHLGELLVTQAEAAHGEHRGHATVLGNVPRKASLAAAVSALRQADDACCRGTLDRLALRFAACRERLAALDAQERCFRDATQVVFESMAEERA